MNYRITHMTRYTYPATVPIGYNRLCLVPRASFRQECIRAQIQIAPSPAYLSERVNDYFGNVVNYISVEEPHNTLEITGHSEVRLTPTRPPDCAASPPWENVREAFKSPACPDLLDACQFTFPSDSIPFTDALLEYALPSFPPSSPILACAAHLMERIHAEFTYDPGATTVSTPIREVLENRRGVCQDFAHLQIGCLRALGLAARYVSGYIAPRRLESGEFFVGTQASHAWLAVYSPGYGWVDLDPTNNVFPSSEHITLAWGRDYDEVAPVRGVFLGGEGQRLEVGVTVVPM